MLIKDHVSFHRFGAAFAFAIALAASPSITAQNREVDLGWTRNAATHIDGISTGDFAGRAVSGAGDVNGDGIDDLLISAYKVGIFAPPGTVYLIYGTQWSPPKTLDLSNADVVMTGTQNGSRTGFSLGAAGDVNNDGFDDFLIGANGYDLSGGNADSGRVYLIYGRANLSATFNLDSLPDGAGTIFASPNGGDLLGSSVAGAGDVNGDGTPDILIGSSGADTGGLIQSGQAVLVYGSDAFGNIVDVGSITESEGVFLNGSGAVEHAGRSVASAGYFNNDGFADIILGADDADANGPESGRAYVVYGSPSLPGIIALGSLGSAGLTIDGPGAGDNLGESVSGGGDVNGDGFDDVVVGSHQFDDTGSNEGLATIIYGGSSLPTELDAGNLGAAGVTLTGIDGSDEAGFSVAMTRTLSGDVNGDGFADVLVSARQGDPHGGQSGEVYLLHGNNALPTSLSLESLSFRGVQLNGTSGGDRAGDSLAMVGDFNNDGFEDYAIGARFAQNDTGEVTVVQGACNMLNAAGPTGEGQTFTLTAHGTPFRLSVLMFSGFVAPAPLDTGVGPFWLGNPFKTWQLKQHDTNGQWSVNLTVPVGVGLSGLTVYFQVYEDPQPPFCNISQLLATPIP
jgi:hypothetical protein